MDNHEIKLLAENEREWRQYMIQQLDELSKKVDGIDKELSTFKVRMLTIASVLSGGLGFSADYIKQIFNGG